MTVITDIVIYISSLSRLSKEFFIPLPDDDSPVLYRWTIPDRDPSRLDSDVVYDEGRKGMTECFAADANGLKFNAGFVRVDTEAPTRRPTSPPKVEEEEEEETSPQFCADVISVNNFDFMGCSIPCNAREDCPDGTFCAYTDACGPG